MEPETDTHHCVRGATHHKSKWSWAQLQAIWCFCCVTVAKSLFFSWFCDDLACSTSALTWWPMSTVSGYQNEKEHHIYIHQLDTNLLICVCSTAEDTIRCNTMAYNAPSHSLFHMLQAFEKVTVRFTASCAAYKWPQSEGYTFFVFLSFHLGFYWVLPL